MKPHLQLKDLFLNDNSCDIFRQVHADTYVWSVFLNVTMCVSGQMMLTRWEQRSNTEQVAVVCRQDPCFPVHTLYLAPS